MTCFRLFFSVWTICLYTTVLHARIVPTDGAVLNYTQVMFEYDEVRDADYYLITIQSITGDKPIFVKNNSLAFIQKQRIQFGKKYFWKYEAYKNNKSVFSSPTYSFEIRTSFQTSKEWLKTSVEINDTANCKDGIIFLDYMGMAINRRGEPVWYMPVEKDSLENLKMRNVKMTPGGTITYLDNTDCFEKDINANIIWKAPNNGQVSGDKQEYYHHDFFKMDDGTYIAAGYRFINEPNLYDNNVMCKVRYNTLIQYNSEGKVLWLWDESRHADKKSLYGDSGPSATEVTGTHMNGVAYYKPDDAFICSFRDNSSILKISKKTGEILYNLGDSLKKFYPDEVPFKSQHGPSLMSNGSIVVYNNNLDRSAKKGSPSYPIVMIFNQPTPDKQSRKIWEYECISSRYLEGIFGKEGYASQLPYNDNLLVCMGGANYVFEVTPGKKIVWQCTLQKFDDNSKSWTAINNYRCSYASSLYPCYFTLQSANQTAGKIQLRINNEGTEDCTYTIEANGRIIETGVTVSAEKNKQVDINTSDIIKNSETVITITVYPSVNKNLAREISFH